MPLRINTNVMAINAHRVLSANDSQLAKTLQRLSSGLRINGAQDDAAGLAISEKFRAQVNGLNQASANTQDAINMIQTAEGALNETEAILQRMRQLAVQAASDTLTVSDRNNLTDEIIALTEEIDRIARQTQFNSYVLLNGGTASTSGFTFQVGANANQWLNVRIEESNAEGLKLAAFTAGVVGTDTVIDFSGMTFAASRIGTEFVSYDRDGTDVDLTIDTTEKGYRRYLVRVDNAAAASTSIAKLDDALATVSARRSKLGAIINRLEHTINNLNVQTENMSSSESRIRDLDMAAEMSTLTKQQIITQSSQAMLAQANQLPQQILQLLRG